MVISDDISAKFRFIFEDELVDEIKRVGSYQRVQPDTLLIDIGEPFTRIPLVISGSIKIMTEDKEGNELLLYYLEYNDTCAMTLNSSLKGGKSNIRAWTEDYCELVFVPKEMMDEWMMKYKSWRSFVLESYNSRLHEMLDAIDNLAFHNLEERLYKYLSDKVKVTGSNEIKMTHFQIANDLNSSRVVVSRLMKKLEKENRITQHRNGIQLTEYASS